MTDKRKNSKQTKKTEYLTENVGIWPKDWEELLNIIWSIAYEQATRESSGSEWATDITKRLERLRIK